MNIFKKKPYFEATAGEWRFTFYFNGEKLEECYLDITTDSGAFGVRIGGASHAYGYLLAAAQQGMTEQLHGYVTLLYIPAMALTKDQGLCDEITRAINKWHKRLEIRAEKAAKATTDAQIAGDEALLGDVIAESKMSKKQLKAKRKAEREVMREILTEQGDD